MEKSISQASITSPKSNNFNGIGHFATECKNSTDGRSQALITKKTDWADSPDSDGEVNYALMANIDSDFVPSDTKVPYTTITFDIDDISELRIFLKCLHVSCRDQTLKNERIKIENSDFKRRNDHLEAELMFMLETEKERNDDVYV